MAQLSRWELTRSWWTSSSRTSPHMMPQRMPYMKWRMKMGNALIEEHVAKFKMLVTKLKLEKNEAVVEYFRETSPFPSRKTSWLSRNLQPPWMNGTNGQSNFRTILFTWRVPLPSLLRISSFYLCYRFIFVINLFLLSLFHFCYLLWSGFLSIIVIYYR